jgi:adenylyltransferase/sulfurtransferase
VDYDAFCGVRGEEAPAETGRVPEIEVEELKRKLDASEDVFLLDVRERHEVAICGLGGHLVPLGELAKRAHELDSSRDIVVYCHLGVRSAKAAAFLRQAGFRKVRSLAGGVRAWADRIDGSMPKY